MFIQGGVGNVNQKLAYATFIQPTDNPEGLPNTNLNTLDPSVLTVEPGLLAYDPEGLLSNLHLALDSPLVNAGDPGVSDVDGTRADLGAYGGHTGGLWDRDLDGVFDWFWPGTLEDAPAGFDPDDYDADDSDPAVR